MMKLAILFSGGKDSTMALYKALQEGHEVKYLVSAYPSNPDSFLFHTANIHITEMQAKALGIPFVKVEVKSLKDIGEAEELEAALRGLDIEGIAVGGVSSNYQGRIFGEIAESLGLKVYSPYWKKPHIELIEEAIGAGFEIIFTSVSAEGLTLDWLGRVFDREALEDLKILNEKYGVEIGGEGGEYCTTVLDGPIFIQKIKLINIEKLWKGMSGKLIIKEAELEKK